MIKNFLVFWNIALTGVVQVQSEKPLPDLETDVPVQAERSIPEPISYWSKKTVRYYHQDVGIPMAKRIYDSEMAMKMKDTKEDVGVRIINGTKSILGDHIYFAGIVIHFEDNLVSMCGCSLVTEKKSLTAAHCWFDGEESPQQFELVFGPNTLFYGGYRIFTKDVIMHENFNIRAATNDIALINHSAVKFTNYINKVQLPTSNKTYVGQSATAVGFGRVYNMDNKRGNLNRNQTRRQVTVPVIANNECNRDLPIHNGNICTRGTKGSKIGTCQGDSGGPLTVLDSGSIILIGITSFGGYLCDAPPYMSAYTDVAYFMHWIKSKL